MKKTIIALVIAILLISSFPASVFAALPDNSAPVSDSSSQRILVKFKSGTSLSEAAQIHRQLSGQAKETISGIGVQVVTVPKGQAVKMAKAYSSNARVAYAEPDGIVEALAEPNDTYFAMQWSLQKVRAPEAWNVTTGSPNVTIAILDTGVDLDHPDLANKIISNINFSSSPTADDVYGHGTHVAGIAAAITNNGIGVAGLGYSTSIMNVKVLGDDGKGDCSGVAQGIIWAADNGAQIINLSLGGSDTSSTLEDAINYAWSKGVVVVAAAGNNGNSNPFYPAYYPNCIAVAATDINDVLAAWSDRGDWVDVAAPGVSVYSTMKNGAYCYMSGTSMASPYVAGLAALVFTTVSDTNGNGKLNDEVRSQIEATCDNISVSGIGYGRTNAARAVGNVPVLLGKISGQVTDAKDSSAIPGVRVSDGTRTALTDTAGKYTIDNAAPGSYQVTASKDGYQSSSLTVNVLSGGTTVANFSLSQIVVPGSISGSITDAVDGSPISGAQVSDGTRTTVTDALGSYSIDNVPPGTYQVTPSKADYQSSSLAVSVLSGATSVANFSLSQILTPGRITGSVTDVKDGSPIVGATLSAGTRTVTTDASGKYAIANVPPGAYAVVASKDGYESSSLTVNVYSGGTTLTNFSLSQIFTPGSISGSVTDAKDGSAISGAQVSAGTRTATTDATGTYSITNVPPGSYQVVASKAGYQSSSLPLSVLAGATAVANLSLSQIIVPGSITGSVTDVKDGSPIAGATVTDGIRTTTTDATGKYTITNVPPGSYQVVASKTGYQSSSLTLSVLAGATAVANLSLSQIIVPGSITGSVTDVKDGSPIAGATVTDGTRTTTTDATGKYTITNVPPGSYQVVASKAGYQSSSLTLSVLAGATAVANLSLSQIIVPGSITGLVTDAKDASPIAGATVTDGIRTALTDATGRYTLNNVPAGSYQVVASKAGYQNSSLTVSVYSGGTTLTNLSLSQIIVPGSITGSVTDAKDASPIAGATVSDGTTTALTDGAGTYTINDVPAGSYQVVGSKVGYQNSSLTVNVYSGGTTLTNLSLSQIIVPGSITGLVTDAKDASPIAGATVSDGIRTALTDATGKYTISNVPAGSYQVVASKEGYQNSSLTVNVYSGGTTLTNFSLSQIIVPGSISGSVTDSKDGSPIVGATLSAGTRTVTTDASGKYAIVNVPPGAYAVVASKDGYESSSLTVNVYSGGTTLTNFSLSQIIVPGSISGSVTDSKAGSPIVGATVSDGTRTATTDATGTYSIANVPPGTYQVTASKSGYQSSSLTLSVLAGATAVANLSLSQIIVTGNITGSVTDAKDASPIAGATVSDGTTTALTDGAGTYTINDVPAGSYQVVASKEGYQSSSLTVTVLSGPTAIANLALSQIILPGSITGLVTDAKDASPIAGATVSDGTTTALTDGAGTYTINDVPAGSYQVVASKEGYQSSSLTVTVLSGPTAIANLSLSQIIVTGNITGSVTDAKDASPMVGAAVSDGTRTVLTDATGKYTISDIPAGSYQVVAGKEGYQSLTSTATVVSGGTAMLDFSLNQKEPAANAIWVDSIRFIKSGRDLYVEVRVVRASGVLSQAKVRLSLQCSNGKVWSFSGYTNTAGLVRFRLSRAPVGSYQATVTSLTRNGFIWNTSRGVTSSLFLSQIIVPDSITGSVTDAKGGSPMVGVTVSDGTRTALTDATGKYTINDVPSGSYQVVASKDGYESLASTATVVPGGTAMLDFSLNQRAPASKAMWADSIRFIKSGTDLYVEVRVVSDSSVLSRAKVRLSLQCSNGKVWSFSGNTKTAGLVRFRLSRAPAGSYQATVTNLTRSGFTWDTSRGITTSADYALSLSLSYSNWQIGPGIVLQYLWHL